MKKFLNNYDYKFGIIIFIICIIFAILMPIYQVPDEATHLKRIYINMNQDIDLEETYQDFGTYLLMYNDNFKVDKKEYFDYSKKLDRLDFKIPKIAVIKYLPQTIALFISHLFRFNTFMALFLMELFACISYTICCVVALKLMPVKKTMMKFLMLMPICIQEAGSLSCDSLLLGLSFVFIAYILNLKYRSNIKIKDLLIGLFILLGITICKLPYCLFGFMFLLLIDKIKINNKTLLIYIKENRYKVISTIIILIPIMLLIFTLNQSSRELVAFILCPKEFISIVVRTISKFSFFLLYSASGDLSWFNIGLSYLYSILLLIMLLLTFFTDNIKLTKIVKILILVLIIVFVSSITISLLDVSIMLNNSNFIKFNSLHETISYIKNNNDMVIYGLQGRYFLPFIPLLGLLFNSNKVKGILDKIKFKYICNIFYVLSYIYIFVFLLNAYWF